MAIQKRCVAGAVGSSPPPPPSADSCDIDGGGNACYPPPQQANQLLVQKVEEEEEEEVGGDDDLCLTEERKEGPPSVASLTPFPFPPPLLFHRADLCLPPPSPFVSTSLPSFLLLSFIRIHLDHRSSHRRLLLQLPLVLYFHTLSHKTMTRSICSNRIDLIPDVIDEPSPRPPYLSQ
ncbi:unnamed protein product, partial [Taenia asiatica]|uniref:Uncharacterized protein n=1 Tax=Taenia asiatica TaxID=60517 RepID=A0A0R3VX01_TAEAS